MRRNGDRSSYSASLSSSKRTNPRAPWTTAAFFPGWNPIPRAVSSPTMALPISGPAVDIGAFSTVHTSMLPRAPSQACSIIAAS